MLAYNKWQDLRYRRQAERSFGANPQRVAQLAGAFQLTNVEDALVAILERGAHAPRVSRPAPSRVGLGVPAPALVRCLVFREGAENCARGGRAPLSILEFELTDDAP